MTEAAAHAAIVARAIKASGVLVRIEPGEFALLAGQQEAPLVIRSRAGFFRKHWRYLMGYKGLAFLADSPDPLPLPGRAQVMDAKEIWIPS